MILFLGCATTFMVHDDCVVENGIEGARAYLENAYAYDSCWIEDTLENEYIRIKCK